MLHTHTHPHTHTHTPATQSVGSVLLFWALGWFVCGSSERPRAGKSEESPSERQVRAPPASVCAAASPGATGLLRAVTGLLIRKVWPGFRLQRRAKARLLGYITVVVIVPGLVPDLQALRGDRTAVPS